MFQRTSQLVAGFALLALVVVSGRQAMAQKKHTMAAASKMTRAQKLAFAMSAAPPEIGRHATIMDATDMSKPKQLRAGTNGWVCYYMVSGGSEAMCLDKERQKWAGAW